MRSALIGLVALAAPGMALALETSFSAPGASEDLAEALEGSSSALAADKIGLETGQEILSAALSDYRTLVQILYDAGYFSPVVSIKADGREASDIPLINPPSQIGRIDIKVEIGRPYRFGLARVAPLPPGTELPEDFATGQPAGTGKIVQATSVGRDAWRDIGHAKAQVGAQRITANFDRSEVNADVTLLPGPQLRFGNLRIVGNENVRTDAIESIMGFPTGEIYSPELVRKSTNRLRRTGTFSSVALIEAETPNADGTLDFEVQLDEQLPRRLSLGVEVQSTDGLTLSGTWTHRNLFGGAERFRLDGEIGNIGGAEDIEGRLAFRLEEPAKLGPDDSLFYYGALERFDREHYTLNQLAFGFGVRRVYSDEFFGEASLQISTASSDDAFGDGRKFNLISLPVRAEYDRRNIPENATSGYFIALRATPFLGFSDSQSGLQMTADGRYYQSLSSSDRVVLAGRLQIGSVVGSSIEGTSPDLLFFSGGAGTVRGQPFQSLGVPVNGDIAGGRSLIAANLEVRTKVTDTISIVGFYDYGAVDSSSFVGSDAEYHAGAGLGLRYDLGAFGPLQLDLAWPVSGSTDDGLQFYIGIGQAF